MAPQTYFVLALVGGALAALDEGYQMIKKMKAYFGDIVF
jgi:hypothetical protein